MEELSDNSTTSDCNNTFTQEQKNHILITNTVIGSLSFTMCSIAVFLVICLQLYKYFIYRLAMYQVLSSLCLSAVEASYITLLNYNGNIYYQIACKSISFLMETVLWTKLLFTICLVFHLFCLVVCLKNLRKLEIGYVLFSTMFPLLHSWIPFIHNSYGVSGAWCWIRDWKDDCATQKYVEGIIEQFVLLYGPLFISLTLTVIAVMIILVVLAWRAYAHRNQESECLIENRECNHDRKAIKELIPLLAYPVIFYLLSLFPIINRVYGAISYNASFELAFAHSITESFWGFFSGWALIIHIFVMRKLKRERKVQFNIYTKVVVNTGNTNYTTYTEGSSNARSKYSIPAESDIDND